MSAPKVKVTYSLDPEAVKQLERLARIWKTTKSGALRRALDVAADSEPKLARRRTKAQRQAEIDRKLAALSDLQASMNLSKADAEEWARQVREERQAWTLRHER